MDTERKGEGFVRVDGRDGQTCVLDDKGVTGCRGRRNSAEASSDIPLCSCSSFVIFQSSASSINGASPGLISSESCGGLSRTGGSGGEGGRGFRLVTSSDLTVAVSISISDPSDPKGETARRAACLYFTRLAVV